LTRDAGPDAVTDELVGLVLKAVRPARPNGHGAGWKRLLTHEEQIRAWVIGGEVDGVRQEPLSIVTIEELLARQGSGSRTGRCTGSRSSGVRVPHWAGHHGPRRRPRAPLEVAASLQPDDAAS
jgi:hypothetical protein